MMEWNQAAKWAVTRIILPLLVGALLLAWMGLTHAQSTGTIITTTSSSCTITYDNGQLTTSNCDFSKPLANPVFVPSGRAKLTITFEQPLPNLTGSGTISIAPAR